MLTLRTLLRDLDVTVLAGDAGLDGPVRWVHISELADPTPWLSGGELLLTTGMGLSAPEDQRAYVERLAGHGLAGVGFGVGFGHERVPEALVAAATELDFPLLEVPYETPFIAVTEKAFSRLVNEQYAVLQRSISAQERLQRIVLTERGLDAIAQTLAGLIGGAALVFDGRGGLRAAHTFRRELDDALVGDIGAELADRARRGTGRGFAPQHLDLASRALALPVTAGEPVGGAGGAVPQAWVVAIKDQGGLSDFDRLVLHQAVTTVALELLRRRVADATERRLAGDVLGEVLEGTLGADELARRLEPFGLGAEVSALVLAPEPRHLAATEAALGTALRAEAIDGLVAAHGPLAVALLPAALEEELFELADRVVARAGASLGASVQAIAGVGRGVPLARARESFHEARCAVEARRMADGQAPSGVATYRDLGSFQLLLSLQDSDQLKLYCDSLLAPIEDGEGHYGGELMRSLEAFIEANGQWEAAARRLYCHRHTLRYRMRKVEELTGRDLSSARDRIEFWLALRGREVVR